MYMSICTFYSYLSALFVNSFVLKADTMKANTHQLYLDLFIAQINYTKVKPR